MLRGGPATGDRPSRDPVLIVTCFGSALIATSLPQILDLKASSRVILIGLVTAVVAVRFINEAPCPRRKRVD